MLRELYIKNFVLLDEVHLELENHLIVFSGETGAGKSMLLESIRFLAGNRASSDYLGPHGDSTKVVGIFETSNELAEFYRDEMGIEIEPGEELSIKREMGQSGRSRAYVNGVPSSIGVLKRMGQYLIDIHNQDDQRTLLSSSFHRQMLDSYGRLEKKVAQYSKKYERYQELKGELEELESKEKTRQDRLELIEFQLAELEDLHLQEGEKEELVQRHHQLSHAAEIGDTAQKWTQILVEEDNSPQELIGRCLQEAENMATYDERFREIVTVGEEAKILINQLGVLFREVADHCHWDPRELEEIEKRLSELEGAEKKYQREGDDLIELREELSREVDTLTSLDESKDQLMEEIQSLEEELLEDAEDISSDRKKVAPRLSRAIEKELETLGMKGSRFKVDFQTLRKDSRLDRYGMDRTEFFVSPNPGIEPRPLSSVSSGGEMSRIMLALKSILSDKYDIPILFFDEIDSNIGGRLGDIVGERLKKLAQNHQVFCITHLPQIAALGDGHFKIEKRINKNKEITRTLIYSLDGKKRAREIAEMMQGQKVSETGMMQANEMLDQQ